MEMAVKMYRDDNTRVSLLKFVPPGYKVAHMLVSKKGSADIRITFAVSPSSFSETRSNNVQLSKTNAGWFAQRMGPSPVNLTFDGFMLDIEGYLEKHQFLSNWKQFLEDKKTNRMEYQNEYSVKFICMGRTYSGFMQSISFSASGGRPFLHQYSGSFVSLNDTYSYKPDNELKVSTSAGTYAIATKVKTTLGTNVYSILTK